MPNGASDVFLRVCGQFSFPPLVEMAAPVKRRINNPMMEDLDVVEPEVDSDDEDMSAAEMIEANKSEMTEDELADLTYAFTAADMDGEEERACCHHTLPSGYG